MSPFEWVTMAVFHLDAAAAQRILEVMNLHPLAAEFVGQVKPLEEACDSRCLVVVAAAVAAVVVVAAFERAA